MFPAIRNEVRNGAAAVEFAMTAPLIFMILLGALELGHANMVLHAAESAAFDGARAGILPGAAEEDVRAAVEHILAVTRIRGATIEVTPADMSSASEFIEVNVEVPYSQNTLLPPFFTRGLQVIRSCRLSREEGNFVT